ncbi:alpha/beta hydrolase superfamily enzyme, predicted hydrolase [Halovivax ruber XH-70]|uniref:Alpha/beta hydrolase superfamily enzyme, predicted hydrolase n=1 Tax=Halovivax ruber (strain DSM 18193 / JCM 13892 / XH-70) TaxID=797302 RepID=L0IFB0_HALRX|nr:alpha/beta hydrolase [Halovivax ruber]AGB17528.1 alpha/beta hydrolase superfamily enzyme, predicted hydrolase [Halovivax ruber XH-70]
MLAAPADAPGVVVFAHGSASSRKSPRNNFVADVIRKRGLGRLLFDLLTERENRNREKRFDIPLLTDRLVAVTEWVWDREETRDANVGYFGSSTSGASALRGATRLQGEIDAVVSRGGRVYMAAEALPDVRAPTCSSLGCRYPGARTQQGAAAQLTCEYELHVVEGAGHLFEEAAELEEVAAVAAN